MNLTTLLTLFRPYLVGMGLLSIGAIGLGAVLASIHRGWWRPQYQNLLRVSHWMMVLSVTLPWMFLLLPKQNLLRPAAEIWNSGRRGTEVSYAWVRQAPSPQKPSSGLGLKFEANWIWVFFFVLLTGVLVRLFLLGRTFYRLRALALESPVFKRLGSVHILVSDEAGVPFSFRRGGAFIVVPTEYLASSVQLRMALRHEFQHHRNGDTRWNHFSEVLRAFYFWNPLLHWLLAQVAHLQELACDEHVVGHHRYSARAYGRCLIEAAESAVRSRTMLAGTAGMASSLNSATLKRRLQMLLEHRKEKGRPVPVFAVVVLSMVVAWVCYASESAVQKRELSLAEATQYAAQTAETTSIPLEMNDLVLKWLNYLIATPEGQEWMQKIRERMPYYRRMIEGKIQRRQLPMELIAIPMVESGFNNEAVSPPPAKAAGIWQFVEGTAIRFGLRVQPELSIDERKTPPLATEAALDYLEFLVSKFKGDWRLAFKGYNEGENRVDRLIARYGTRDPWELERRDTLDGYLPKVIAMILVLRNPGLVD